MKTESGDVLFADQVGVRSDQVSGRTWGEQGKTRVVRRAGNRCSVNAIFAISNRGRRYVMVFSESFDAKVMCRFLVGSSGTSSGRST
ncbi:transposase [Streptomyces wuyuanensis]|uniref:transposase n=1 Tax=Streptomyces wuyuanensis TaxID=1196353 RepID=UPI0037A19EDC